MERYLKIISRRPYSHNQSVLIQFLLHEFLDCCRLIQEMRLLLKKKRFDTNTLKCIQELLTRMLGPPREENEFFMWMERNGTVRSFNHYCQLICEYEKKGQNECEELLHAVTTALHEFGLSQELMQREGKSLDTDSKHITQILRHLERANTAFNKTRDLIPAILHYFRKDENTLFFLLRHHEEIDSYFSQGFTKDLLTNYYPKGGIEKAKSYIITRYEARGFKQLSQQISHYIEQLA